MTGRLEVAETILSICNLDKKIEIIKVTSDFFKKEYFVDRPSSERLVNKKLQLRGIDIMRNWEICLEEYLIKSYSKLL
jgi:dTDP-4-dehydrorhamnose reductase